MKRIKSLSVNDKPLKLCKLGGVVMFEQQNSEYKRLAYVRFPLNATLDQYASAYIDTGVIPDADSFMEVTFRMIGDTLVTFGHARPNTGVDAKWAVMCNGDHADFTLFRRNIANFRLKLPDRIATIAAGNGWGMIDGVDLFRVEPLESTKTYPSIKAWGNMDLYRFKINDTLDLMPVQRLSDGAVGFRCEITGQFFGNANLDTADQLEAGPETGEFI